MSTSTLDLFRLTGRRALITGGGGLLGPVFAAALCDAGAEVHLLDASADGLARAASRLGRVETRVLDITDEAAVEGAVTEIGRVDILVNAAAVNPKFEPDDSGAVRNAGAFTSYSLANWQRSMDVNLTGAFLVTRAVCRAMEEAGQGAIVNIASHYGMRGPDQRIYRDADGRQEFFKPVDYSVTKAGILGFTKALAAYYRGTEIRVNALTPGGAFNGHDDTFVENYAARTVLGRMAEPDEYRGAILFLCSDASSYMTGTNLVVDGGWTAL
jgi:NAD(P)-dependent dehydrogenase (short-subunit alcohol dehydrogenase family)